MCNNVSIAQSTDHAYQIFLNLASFLLHSGTHLVGHLTRTMSSLTAPPRLSPTIRPARTPSPSHSPRRHGYHRGRSGDGFVRELSPTSALRVFTQSAEVPVSQTSHLQNLRGAEDEETKLVQRLAHASSLERALGIRVARAAQQLHAWCREIETWGWRGRFEEPSEKEKDEIRIGFAEASSKRPPRGHQIEAIEHKKRNGNGDIAGQPRESQSFNTEVGTLEETEFWGSLPSTAVEAYDSRIAEIRDELVDIGVDELKERVRQIHSDRSRPSSSYSTYSTFSNLERRGLQFAPLDDYEILVTSTLIQALPNLTILNLLLDTWTSRLLVLRQVPRWLAELSQANQALKLASQALYEERQRLKTRAESGNHHMEGSQEEPEFVGASKVMSRVLRGKIENLGKKLDWMLDVLEGHEDVLPDNWIDDFESLEAGYTKWVVAAERTVLRIGMRDSPNKHEIQVPDPLLSDDGTLHMEQQDGKAEPATIQSVEKGLLDDHIKQSPETHVSRMKSSADDEVHAIRRSSSQRSKRNSAILSTYSYAHPTSKDYALEDSQTDLAPATGGAEEFPLADTSTATLVEKLQPDLLSSLIDSSESTSVSRSTYTLVPETKSSRNTESQKQQQEYETIKHSDFNGALLEKTYDGSSNVIDSGLVQSSKDDKQRLSIGESREATFNKTDSSITYTHLPIVSTEAEPNDEDALNRSSDSDQDSLDNTDETRPADQWCKVERRASTASVESFRKHQVGANYISK